MTPTGPSAGCYRMEGTEEPLREGGGNDNANTSETMCVCVLGRGEGRRRKGSDVHLKHVETLAGLTSPSISKSEYPHTC